MNLKRKLGVVAAGLTLAISGLVTASVPSEAATVQNMFECDPDTGWCYQSNPPYRSEFKRACRWNENVHNTWGMYYTDCTPGFWRPYVYA